MSLSRGIALLVILVCVTSESFYKKVTHTTDPQGKCLDGSIPALYIHQGSQPNNILIFLLGGGTCASTNKELSLGTCFLRSSTRFGSSLLWPDTLSDKGLGMLEVNSENKFSEWTKIIVTNCDGALFQGNTKIPAQYNGTKIYFRGSVYMRAHFKWIDQQYSFANANKIVMAGSSSGGMVMSYWIDYLRGMINDPTKLYGIVDSGIFLDPESLAKIGTVGSGVLPLFASNALLTSNNQASSSIQSGGTVQLHSNVGTYVGQVEVEPEIYNSDASAPVLPFDSIKQFMTLTNVDERPPNTNCLKTLSGNDSDWRCIFSPKAYQTVQTKMLWINSQYDQYVIKNVLKISCLSEGSSQYTLQKCTPPQLLLLDLYRGLVNTHVLADLIGKGHSVWSNACSWHVALSDSKVYDWLRQKAPFYSTKRATVKDSVETFIFKDQRIVIVDQFPWPSNRLCAF